MSDNYSTDELAEWLMERIAQFPYFPAVGINKTIIARLRAADALNGAAKGVMKQREEDPDLPHYLNIGALERAIADYEGISGARNIDEG